MESKHSTFLHSSHSPQHDLKLAKRGRIKKLKSVIITFVWHKKFYSSVILINYANPRVDEIFENHCRLNTNREIIFAASSKYLFNLKESTA